MTVTIQNNNPNLLTLNDSNAIYFTSEDFLLKYDTLIIQDGRKSETHWQVIDVSETQSKAVKPNFKIATLSILNQ
jgi:hypothetical protein